MLKRSPTKANGEYKPVASKSLTDKGVSAAIWSYGGNFSRLIIQFVIGVILARLVGPANFGPIAVSVLLISIGQLFVDFGFNSAIVQAPTIEEHEVDHLFTLQILIGGLMTAVIAASSVLIAEFFNQPSATPIIRWMSAIFVLRALGQTSVALLTRELRFRAIQTGSVGGYLVGYVLVGLPMAFAGGGAWSLVAAQLVQATVTSVIAIIQVGKIHRVTLRGGKREFVKFGRNVVAANLGSWTLSNIDSLVVGHFSGAIILGLYSRAMSLAATPMGAVASGIQGVLFAAVSRAQDNEDGIRRTFLICTEFFILTAGSVLLSLAATAPTVIGTLYGQRWIGAVPFFRPLCLAMVLNGVLAFIGPTLMALGCVDKENKSQWIAVTIMVPVLLIAVQFNTAAVAWSIIPLYFIRLALLAKAFHERVRFVFREVLKNLLPAIVASLSAAGCAGIVDVRLAALAPVSRLGADVAASGFGLIVAIFVFRRKFVNGPLGQLLIRQKIVPTVLRSWMANYA